MGQAEVMEFLQYHPVQWFTAKEIGQNIDISSVTVNGSLKRLTKQGVVEKRRNIERTFGFQYRFKR